MTDHDKKISGVEAPLNSVQQQAGPSEGRRRLVKGALAAPAVMTLMNGRLAMASMCTGNEGSTLDLLNLNQNITLNPEAAPMFYEKHTVPTYEIPKASGTDIYFSFENVYYDANGVKVTNPGTLNQLEKASSSGTATAYKLRVYDNQAITHSCWTSIT